MLKETVIFSVSYIILYFPYGFYKITWKALLCSVNFDKRFSKVGRLEPKHKRETSLCRHFCTRWIMVLSRHVELRWLFSLETITRSLSLLRRSAPLSNSTPRARPHVAKENLQPDCAARTERKTGAFFFFLICWRTPRTQTQTAPAHTRTHADWHKGESSIPMSFPYCCSDEKFTLKWSHRLFRARLWPRECLKELASASASSVMSVVTLDKTVWGVYTYKTLCTWGF